MSEETKRKLDEMLTAIGALGEVLGSQREAFMRNGFTRWEAVYLCGELMKTSFSANTGRDNYED